MAAFSLSSCKSKQIKEAENVIERTFGVLPSNIEFELLDKNQNKIYTEITTNKDGIATIDNLLPGIYYIRETKTLEGYQLYSKLIKVELELNEETTVNVINSEKEPEIYKEEKKTELAVKEKKSNIKVKETGPKLPKTGM